MEMKIQYFTSGQDEKPIIIWIIELNFVFTAWFYGNRINNCNGMVSHLKIVQLHLVKFSKFL